MTDVPKGENVAPPAGPPAGLPLRRGEWIAIVLFVALNVAVPLATTELYPFSRFPMFAGAPRQVAFYRVTDPSGRELPARDFGLELNADDNPPVVGHGFLPPATLNVPGEVPDRAAVTAWVRARLAAGPSPAYVDVTREVYGPAPDGSFGLAAREAWRVPNPRRKGEGPP